LVLTDYPLQRFGLNPAATLAVIYLKTTLSQLVTTRERKCDCKALDLPQKRNPLQAVAQKGFHHQTNKGLFVYYGK
jgi:hypothetical protein